MSEYSLVGKTVIVNLNGASSIFKGTVLKETDTYLIVRGQMLTLAPHDDHVRLFPIVSIWDVVVTDD